VSADVSLEPSTEYHYRLSATDSGGTSPGGTNHGEDQTLVTHGPPRVDSESSSGVVVSSATVEAQIDPYGEDTTRTVSAPVVRCSLSTKRTSMLLVTKTPKYYHAIRQIFDLDLAIKA
jgi:hypothetical protein